MTHSASDIIADRAGTTPAQRLVRFLMWLFVGAIGFSLGGVMLIKVAPNILQYFGGWFPTLVKAPTWTYMGLLPVIVAGMYYDQLGGRRVVLLLIAGSLIGAGAELLGTTTGFPFGAYAYTDWLGPKILDHVPYFIPLSWFAMGLVCYDLALRVADRPLFVVVLGAAFMVGWDVSLDPAMSRAFPFWTYGETGFFYGMPLTNWLGWFVTSAVIMAVYSRVVRGIDMFSRRAPFFFFLNCLFPFTLSLEYGLYGATVAGVVVTALILFIVNRSRRTHEPALA